MIKYIIFDLDGVLVDAREIHYHAMNNALKKFGYEITREEHLSTYDGLPTQKKLKILTEQKGLSPELYNDIWKEKQRQTSDIVNAMKPDERMRAILKRLRDDGYSIIVGSNSIRESTKLMLLRCGLMEYVDFFISNQDVRNPKPHPEMYLKAMIKSGALPKECLVVEDSHYGRQAAADSGAYLCPVKDTEDVTYEKIMASVKEANQYHENKKSVAKWQGRQMNVVIPLAGAGKKFQERGYTFPKPLIDIYGKPMIQWIVENLNTEGNFIFIVLKEHYDRYQLEYLLNLISPGCVIIQVDQPTQGAACTALLAEKYINNENPLVIANSDQYLEWNSNNFFYAMAHEECCGGIVTFKSTHPRWSFARQGEDGFVVEVAEKRPISDNATAGVYYWRHGESFVRSARRMIEKNIRTNNEFYVCPTFNELLQEGKKIRMFPIEKMWSFGTPEDLDLFLGKFPKQHPAA